MGAVRSTAAERRGQAVGAGMRVFADHGLTMAAVQQVANDIGVSQPYVFRLFGSKQALFLACLDELEGRVVEVFRAAAEAGTDDPLRAMGAAFRDMVADGVVTGLWLQACAAARRDEAVAARCRALLGAVLDEVGRLTGVGPDGIARFMGDGALVVLLQAIGADLSGGSRAAVRSLRREGTIS
ncbi:TetR/AcrR family transcriptional regulator [Actinomadura sp. 21ATH]|uniref:TetR/AcrR family transcriptional regulator n=1 Tax=Actinomadura sp. 21ATH TaxID=1735444 RepID=UPI0035C12002